MIVRRFKRPPAGADASRWWRRPSVLIVAASAWLATLGNAALWRELQRVGALDGLRGAAFASAMAVMVAGVLVALLALLAWRWTLKPALVALLVAAAAGSHFMLAYGVVIDTTMVTNVLQTDPREAGDLLSLRLLASIALLGALPAWLAWRWPIDYGRWPRRAWRNLLLLAGGLALALAAVLAAFQPLAATMRSHKQLRYLINPLNTVYALGDLAAAPFKRDTRTRLALGRDAQPSAAARAAARPPLLLLVVGETARAANFSLNGYARPTNPQLADLPLASWRNAWSCGTSTAASLPCMFSHLGRDAFGSRRAEYDNLLDVVQQAGYAVLWLDNQSGCKGLCDRVPHAATSARLTPGRCAADGECADEALLDGLDERLAALPAERRARGVLLVLHPMGSHGPAYHKRLPAAFKRFLPECATNQLQACSRDQVVNAYDNTIVYADHVLARAVAWLHAQSARYDPALLYVSDHGESLGENNLYLHGLPYALAPEGQKRVPWITWLGEGFAQRQAMTLACLQQRADAEVSHDHLFHSVLGLLQISTSAYRADRDAYAPCRPAPR